MYPADVGIVFEQQAVGFHGENMQFGIRKLRFQAADNRTCEHNVADGTEANDQDLFQLPGNLSQAKLKQ